MRTERVRGDLRPRTNALRVCAGRSAFIAPVFACAVVCGGTESSVHSATTQPTAAGPSATPSRAGQQGPYRVAQIKVAGGAIISYPMGAEPQLHEAELDALESLQLEHTREGSPLQGTLDLSRVSLLGWSLAGGGAWSDATTHP